MKTTARFSGRKNQLERIFSKVNLDNSWKISWKLLREGDIRDLFDYYDYNYLKADKIGEIRREITTGHYKSRAPVFYRIEKKLGICRHLIILNPDDLLVLQTISAELFKEIIKIQPSKKAFFSRDHASQKSFGSIVPEYSASFLTLWVKFQKEICDFTEEFPFLVSTDISTFYDNINLEELRRYISSIIRIDEVVLDLLFQIIESLSWTPDYLPSTHRGLPVSNCECIRLLAHSFLFEIDEVLQQRTKDNFARWMDDIDFGVRSKSEAKNILSEISDVLKSRGLSLNLAKTRIYTANEAVEHFMFIENKYLDDIGEKIKSGTAVDKKDFRSRFKSLQSKGSLKAWDKVVKRYLTAFNKMGLKAPKQDLVNLFVDHPALRKNILWNLSSRKSDKSLFEEALKIIGNVESFDDITLYQLCHWLLEKEIGVRDNSIKFANEFIEKIGQANDRFKFYCKLMLLAKYGESRILRNYVKKFENLWKNDQFLSRQIAAIMPRIIESDSIYAQQILDSIIAIGHRDAASVALVIQSVLNNDYSSKISAWLFPSKQDRPYQFSKFILLLALKHGDKTTFEANVPYLSKYKIDSWYKKWLGI